MVATYAFVSFVLCHTSEILCCLGQPQDVAEEAAVFVRYLLPGIPFVYAYELFRKILQAKNEASPLVVSALVSNMVNACVGYFLVHCTRWGWLGAAVARTLSNIALIPTLMFILHFNGNRANPITTNEKHFHYFWHNSFPWKSLSGTAMLEFLALGIPGMFQLVFEW